MDQRNDSNTERVVAWATVAMAISAVISVAVGIYQWKAIRSQLEIMQADQRPWIELASLVDVDNSAAVDIKLKNFGKSPAMRTRVSISVQAQGLGAPVTFNTACNTNCSMQPFVFPPDFIVGFRYPRAQDPPVALGTIRRIGIRIDYGDESGKSHTTGICMLSAANHGASDACPDPGSNYSD